MHHSDVMAIDVKANPTTGTTRSPAQTSDMKSVICALILRNVGISPHHTSNTPGVSKKKKNVNVDCKRVPCGLIISLSNYLSLQSWRKTFSDPPRHCTSRAEWGVVVV